MSEFEFLPMFEHEARRHEARAAYWRSKGNEAYAKASDAKAARWRSRQTALTRQPHANPLVEAKTREVERRMASDMERALFQVSGSSTWDRMPMSAKAATVIIGTLYFVALPIWTVINAP